MGGINSLDVVSDERCGHNDIGGSCMQGLLGESHLNLVHYCGIG